MRRPTLLICSILILIAFRIEAAVLIPVSDKEVRTVVEAEGSAWILTNGDGVYKIDGKKLLPIETLAGTTATAAVAWQGSPVLIGTLRQGLYAVDAVTLETSRIASDEIRSVTALGRWADRTLLGTADGLYLLSGDSTTNRIWPTARGEYIRAIHSSNAAVFLGTNRNLYRLDDLNASQLRPLAEDSVNIRAITSVHGSLWITTEIELGYYGDCYRYQSGQLEKFRDFRELGILGIAEVENETWLATMEGISRVLDDTRVEEIWDMDSPVHALAFLDGSVFFGTPFGSYLMNDDTELTRFPGESSRQGFTHFSKVAGHVWAWSVTDGVYRLDKDVDIEIALVTPRTLFGYPLLTSSSATVMARYVRNGQVAYPESLILPPKFHFQDNKSGAWEPVDVPVRVSTLSSIRVPLSVRDQFGNTASMEINAVPGQLLLLLLVGLGITFGAWVVLRLYRARTSVEENDND